MPKGETKHLEGKRGRTLGAKHAPLSIRAMRWAAKHMRTPVIGEPIPGNPEKQATDKTPGAVQPPGDLHLVFWQMAQDATTRREFFRMFIKEEVADHHKSKTGAKDPDAGKTQATTELVDKLIADWDQGKRA